MTDIELKEDKNADDFDIMGLGEIPPHLHETAKWLAGSGARVMYSPINEGFIVVNKKGELRDSLREGFHIVDFNDNCLTEGIPFFSKFKKATDKPAKQIRDAMISYKEFTVFRNSKLSGNFVLTGKDPETNKEVVYMISDDFTIMNPTGQKNVLSRFIQSAKAAGINILNLDDVPKLVPAYATNETIAMLESEKMRSLIEDLRNPNFLSPKKEKEIEFCEDWGHDDPEELALTEAEMFQRTDHLTFNGRVFVYYNINLSNKLGRPLWSIRNEQTGKIIGHDQKIVLRDATFVVGQAGKERVRDEKRKNVHAGVRGYIVHGEEAKMGFGSPITYNPYKYDTFVELPDEKPVKGAKLVHMVDKKVGATGIEYIQGAEENVA